MYRSIGFTRVILCVRDSSANYLRGRSGFGDSIDAVLKRGFNVPLNNAKDVFMLRLNAGDSDHDGLPDDWEIAYFGDLAQDGEGDFDHDGSTNRQEYLAGTNPANNASVFQVLTLTALSNGQTTLLWSAVAGRTYRVQFKDDLERPGWTDLGGEVTADGTQASAVDPDTSAASHRFYRVVLVR